MLSVIVAICLIISIYRCIVDIKACAEGEAWGAVRDLIFIIISITAAIILIE